MVKVMDKKKIVLNFGEKSLPAVSGNENGIYIYKKQVEGKLSEEDYQRGFIIEFPNQIEIIGSSFLQGFCKEMIKKIGYDGIQQKVQFITSSEELTREIYDDII